MLRAAAVWVCLKYSLRRGICQTRAGGGKTGMIAERQPVARTELWDGNISPSKRVGSRQHPPVPVTHLAMPHQRMCHGRIPDQVARSDGGYFANHRRNTGIEAGHQVMCHARAGAGRTQEQRISPARS